MMNNNINKNIDANQFAKQLTALLKKATNNELEIRSILLDALNKISNKEVLRELINDLKQNEKYRNYCYKNNNGFYIIFLSDPEIGTQLRLHVWLEDGHYIDEQPHRHRMSFASKVISGTLISTQLKRVTNLSDASSKKIYGKFQEGVIKVPKGNFDTPTTIYEERGIVYLEKESVLEHKKDQTYYFDYPEIHVVKTELKDGKPNISLTVWDLPHQDSIVYEPIKSEKISRKSKPVERLDSNTYERILDLVLSEI